MNVMGLMAKSLQAIQSGYQNGLDLNDVATRYVTESVTWQVFAHSQAIFVADVIQHGQDEALTRIQPSVRQQCGLYQPAPSVTVGPPPSSDQPDSTGSAGPPAFNYSPPPGT